VTGDIGPDPVAAFQTLDLRVGRVLRVEPNEHARKPSYKLWIDFGPLGQRTSSAQLREVYRPDELIGRLVIAAVNLGTRNIAGFASEVLVLGLPNEAGEVVVLSAERQVPLGGRVY
jgi:tRNA-binding protein